MSHFAEVDENGNVLRVIVAEQDLINSGAVGDPSRWVQTSYTRSMRKHYASPGFTYDRALDAFVPPKPFPSWALNKTTCEWEAPTPLPDDRDKTFIWDEKTQSWRDRASRT